MIWERFCEPLRMNNRGFGNRNHIRMKAKFLILWCMGLVGTIAVLPYAFTLQHDLLAQSGQPLWVLVLVSIVQTAVLLAVAIFFGLKLAGRTGLSTLTLFDATTLREMLPHLLLLSVSAGILTGVLITLGDMLFGLYLPELSLMNGQVALWKTLLAAFYGGIVEEILLRLFCLSLFVWILAKLTRTIEPVHNGAIMWTGIVLSSVVFGLGHLPITAALTAITPLVVFRAIVLNGIGGVVFGWLYWKKGLEYSMVAHFTADIVLLAVLPAILTQMS